MMLLKRECWHAAPRWVNVSSFEDGVDGATLDEHRQPFFVKESSSLAFVLSLSWSVAAQKGVRAFGSLVGQCQLLQRWC